MVGGDGGDSSGHRCARHPVDCLWHLHDSAGHSPPGGAHDLHLHPAQHRGHQQCPQCAGRQRIAARQDATLRGDVLDLLDGVGHPALHGGDRPLVLGEILQSEPKRCHSVNVHRDPRCDSVHHFLPDVLPQADGAQA